MRLFKLMHFFSLDLNTYNLNTSRMWLINISLFLRTESLLADSRILKVAASGIKVGNKLFESIGLSPPINILQRHIHEICVKVFRRMNYRKSTVEMVLLKKYEVWDFEV